MVAFHIRLADRLRAGAKESAGGNLVVVLCGGSGRRLATYVIIPCLCRRPAD